MFKIVENDIIKLLKHNIKDIDLSTLPQLQTTGYRGESFYWLDEFISRFGFIKQNDNLNFNSNYISSWTKDKSIAKLFASQQAFADDNIVFQIVLSTNQTFYDLSEIQEYKELKWQYEKEILLDKGKYICRVEYVHYPHLQMLKDYNTSSDFAKQLIKQSFNKAVWSRDEQLKEKYFEFLISYV